MTDDGSPFSPAERVVLRHFAANYLTGRKFACWSFRVVCALGAIATALMAIGAVLHGWAMPGQALP